MRRSRIGAGAVLATLIGLTGGPGRQIRGDERSVIAIVGVTVLPMDRDAVLEDQTVIVEGDRIAALGPAGEVEIPVGASRIDAGGTFLMPGLVDMHVHIRLRDLTAYVANGITSVRNMWGYKGLHDVARRIEAGELTGPTIYSASPGLDGPPGYWPQTQIIEDPARADGLVAAQVAQGWSFVKVYQNLRLAVYDAILVSARTRGIRVVGHVPTLVPVEHALLLGQASLEHLHGYDLALTTNDHGPFDPATWFSIDERKLPDLAARTRAAGAWNCPTLAIWEVFSRDLSPGDRGRVLTNRRAVVAALHAATGRILLGTDSGIDRTAAGTSIHDELDELVAAGLTPYEAIRSGTSAAAEFLEKADEIGSIAVGRRADLLLVDRNPLEGVAALRNLRGVMWHGLWRVDPGLSRQVVPCAPDCHRRTTRSVVH